MENTHKHTIKQGFAAMSKEKRREIARKGGLAAHKKGKAHKLTLEDRSKGGTLSSGNFKFRPGLAQIAGRKGGLISRRKKKTEAKELERVGREVSDPGAVYNSDLYRYER
jgi:general stress protein YciG